MLSAIMCRIGLAAGTFVTIVALSLVAHHAPSRQHYVERYYSVNGPEYYALAASQYDTASCTLREVKVYDDGTRVHICNQ